jgi:hypothetical protein
MFGPDLVRRRRCDAQCSDRLATGTRPLRPRLKRMDYEPVIKGALWDAQELLWGNLRPTEKLPPDKTVKALDQIIASSGVQSALSSGTESALVFYLRAMHLVLKNKSAVDKDTISRLWPILDHPHLYELLGTSRDSRISVESKPPA